MPFKDKEKKKQYMKEYMRKRRQERKIQKQIMRETAKQRKIKEKVKKKAEKSISVSSVIASVNARKQWKNPLKPQNPLCASIQHKLREGKRLTKQEISHMGSCDSCCLAYKEYGYLNSGLGVKSFWSEEEKP